jgi:hypothetical protein
MLMGRSSMIIATAKEEQQNRDHRGRVGQCTI